jgi:hypothetical protein
MYRHLTHSLPLLFLLSLLGACASYNEEHGLQCAPAYAPGTAAYRACLLRNSDASDQGYAYEQFDYTD